MQLPNILHHISKHLSLVRAFLLLFLYFVSFALILGRDRSQLTLHIVCQGRDEIAGNQECGQVEQVQKYFVAVTKCCRENQFENLIKDI
jgi:hypothetical protein